MSLMSGTLESLLLYGGSQQTQGGQPLYSNAVDSQSKEPIYTSSHSTDALYTLTQSKSSKEPMHTNSQSESATFTTSQANSSREPEYNSAQTGSGFNMDQHIQKRIKHLNKMLLSRGISQEEISQRDIASQASHEFMKIAKRRTSAACTTSSSRCEQLSCSTDDDVWESLTGIDTSTEDPSWTLSQGDSTMGTSTTKNLFSPASRRESGTGFSPSPSLGSSTSVCVMDMLGSKHSSTESFMTKKDSTPQDKQHKLSVKPASSRGLSPIRKGPSSILSGIRSPRILQPTSPSASVKNNNKMLNDQCFQVAISEGFGSPSQTLSYKMRPVKRFSYHMHHNRLSGTCSKHAETSTMTSSWNQGTSHGQLTDIMAMSMASSGFTNSSGQPESLNLETSSTSSQGSNQDIFDKKYRYNHTALALQQSGLMKTTIKTAEILRRGKILQAELNKLRKETALFMRSVLSNPENQHFRDIYMKVHHNKFAS